MSKEIIKRPRGTIDYYNENSVLLENIRKFLLKQADLYGCSYFEIPVFEENKLFHRTTGESSDIVTKETFDLISKGDKDYTLRPEYTAGINRSIVEEKLYTSPDLPLRISYFGPVFRYERPQKGRLRQFIQFGVEFVDNVIDLDATIDCLMLCLNTCEKIIGHKLKVKINFLGSFASREIYKTELHKFFEKKIDTMCEDCKKRLVTNPLRILDCKVPEDQEIAKNAPTISDYLTEEDQKEYQNILKTLDILNVSYEKDDRLVRGLDYYTGLVWEIYDPSNLEVGAISGGGKYSRLMSEIGGPDFEGIGFSIGVDRMILSLSEENKARFNQTAPVDVFIIDYRKDGTALKFANDLRLDGYKVAIPSFAKGLGGSFKMADRLAAKFVLIVDSDMLCKVKDMSTREQVDIKDEDLLNYIKEKCHA